MKKTVVKKAFIKPPSFVSVTGATISNDGNTFVVTSGEEATILVDGVTLGENFERISSVLLRFEKEAFDLDTLPYDPDRAQDPVQSFHLHYAYVTDEVPKADDQYPDDGVSRLIFTSDITESVQQNSNYSINIMLNDGSLPCTFTIPYLTITYEIDYDYTEVKPLSVAKDVSANLLLPSGKTSYAIEDINDPVLGISLSHHYNAGETPRWITNFDERLEGKTFTDATGTAHIFKERFYTLSAKGEKKLSTLTASSVTADSDGRLWYGTKEVFRDLRTSKGHRATTRISNVNDAEWVEQRYEEEKQAQEQLRALEEQLCSFVLVNEADGEEISKITTLTISTPGRFEEFLKLGGLLLATGEAHNYRMLIAERDTLSVEEKEEYNETHLSPYWSTAEKYKATLPSLYTEYTIAKANLEALKNSIPVSFLYSDEGDKGYNQSGALVTVQPKNGKPLVINRESYNKNAPSLLRIDSVQNEDGDAMRFYYDSNDRLCRVVNSLGEEAAFSYNGSGALCGITRPDGTALSIEYTDGLITAVNEEHKAVSLTYDISGRLKTLVCTTDVVNVKHSTVETGDESVLANLSLKYTDDGEQKSILITDNLKSVAEQYDFSGTAREYFKLENSKVAAWEKIVLDPETELVTAKETASPACLGSCSYDTFDANRTLAESTQYTYNDFYECTQIESNYTSPSGNRVTSTTTETSYNEKGKPVHIQTTEVRPAAETGTETVTTHERFFYDSADQLVKTERYTEGKEHLLGIEVEEFLYDENGRETGSASYNTLAPSDKFYTECTYDSEGRVKTERDETGRFDTLFEYGTRSGTAYSVKTPDGATLSYAYEKHGKEASVTLSDKEGAGNTQSVFYTEELPTRVKNENHEFDYTYDAKGRVTRIDMDGYAYAIKTYTENADNTDTVKTTYVGFESAPRSITMDKMGKVLKKDNVTCTYSPDGMLTREATRFSESEKLYEYDADHRLVKYTDAKTTPMYQEVEESISYDNKDRATAVSERVNDHTVSSSFTYNDDTETLASMQVASLSAVPSYDALDREVNRTVWGENTFIHGVKTSYIKHGDHATMLPSELAFSSATDNTRLKYVYDEMGNIAKVFENGILSVRYEYDALGRLTREDNRAFAKTSLWTYDGSGNILTRHNYAFTLKPTEELAEETPENSLIYGYEGDHLVSLNGERVIEYDNAHGCPTRYFGKNLIWDKPHVLSFVDDLILTHNTDDLLDSIGGMLIIYGRGGKIVADQHFRYLYDEKGELFGLTHFYGGTEEYVYRRDAQGNIIAILDNTGRIMVNYKYNAWGDCKIEYPEGATVADRSVGESNPFRYRGYYYCSELGLYYLKSRFYDPSIGRFISADSLDYLDPHTVGGVNLFAYCNNNPVMNVDPTGCWSWSVFWKGLATIAVAASAIAVSVATFGAATPLAVTAVAAVTATAGALTAVNGVATVIEAATDYNFVEEAVFQGNEAAYDTYAAVAESVASVGAAALGVYNATGYAKATRAGRKYLGKGYTKYKNGIWRSKDGFRQMRLDKGHLNIELFANPLASKVKNITMMNAHIYYKGFRIWTEIGGKAWFLF